MTSKFDAFKIGYETTRKTGVSSVHPCPYEKPGSCQEWHLGTIRDIEDAKDKHRGNINLWKCGIVDADGNYSTSHVSVQFNLRKM